MKHIGLFEGIGGFSLAGRWMGWETLAWCEINPFGQQVLKYHFPKAAGHADITKTDFTIYRGQCDILTGGFPCQPYSTAGKRLGKEDERHLWPEMLRAIREIQPRWVVGENVRGLTNWNGGMVFNEVQADLEAEGYEVLPFLLPACAVNAPHRRDRIWFIAHANNKGSNSGFKSVQGENEEIPQWNNHSQFSYTTISKDWTSANTHNKGLQGRKVNGSIGRSGQIGNEQSAGFLPPNWQEFPTQSPFCSRNDGVPYRLAGITFSKHRNESIKAYGNAIVPQIAIQIFKAIAYEHQRHP